MRFALAVLGLAALGAGLVYTGWAPHKIQETSRSIVAHIAPRFEETVRSLNPIPLATRLTEKGFSLGQPLLIRLFKEESLLELWLRRTDKFELAMTFPVCEWSGGLGPKLREGDGQSPEGFYFASKRQLKPDSAYYRAINIGFPNAFDRQTGRTGSYLMIHGNCVSIGCYAMTDAGIEDIYTAVEMALASGQDAIPIHALPFRMTAENLTRHASHPAIGFWKTLHEGDRIFQQTGLPPAVFACNGAYVFWPASASPSLDNSCEAVAAW